MEPFVLVALENTLYSYDKPFTYAVPPELAQEALPGCRVTVPFGIGNRQHIGMILSYCTVKSGKLAQKCKPIAAVLDRAPLLRCEQLQLAQWLAEQTFCTVYDAVRAMLPPGLNRRLVQSFAAAHPEDEAAQCAALSSPEKQLYEYLCGRNGYVKKENLCKTLGFAADVPYFDSLAEKGLLFSNLDAVRGVQDASERMVRLSEPPTLMPKLTKKQQEVITLLTEVGSASVREVCYFTGLTPAVTAALEKKGLVAIYDRVRLRSPQPAHTRAEAAAEIRLTFAQELCYEKLKVQYNAGGGTALLFGVTGSGKTQVYLRLIDHILAQGKGVIVMVPEIALTPQMLSLFYGRYGKNAAVFHSGLSAGKRADEWLRVQKGEAKIALGTRSAVFAPLEHIGLIILDEEQEHTYKSEQTPRYSAKEAARFRAAAHGALVVLASATPSIETYAAAVNGKIGLAVLEERYGNAVLPEVITVDMKAEQIMGHMPVLSGVLTQALEETLIAGHQAILLINRRGFNTFCVCRACEQVVTCPHCSISMTYHSANGRMMCHYCGHSREFTTVCGSCGKGEIRFSGYGTQRIETELSHLLPHARVLRMDMDTTSGRYAHETKLEQFRSKEFDILLGTQMVAKGLDFASVTLVGVISADQQLYNDDYRSLEQTFSLLTQVVGRSGRGEHAGRAVIQTLTPENPVIRLAAKQDYRAFYETEIRIRKAMTYPPYCDLCVLGLAGENEDVTRGAAKAAFELLTALCAGDYPDVKLIVLGPMPARIAKVNSKYRFRLILKCRNSPRFRALIAQLLKTLGSRNDFRALNIWANMNPKDAL